MSSRKLRSAVIALVLTGGTLLLPASPAHAGRLGFRAPDGIARQVRERGLLSALSALDALNPLNPLDTLVRRLRKAVQPSGGGMDPNGLD